ncbi:MAG: MFS transporter [Actinomycetota bacterium]
MSPRVDAAVGRTFASLRSSRNFRLYLAGQLVSATGTWMNFTAMAWLVLKLTGSGTALGLSAALSFGPVLLFGAFGGVLADRFDKRRILMWTQAAYATVALTMSVLVFTDVVELWMVFALAFTAGIVTSIDMPSRQSFYVEMVGEEVLTNAVSLNSAAFTGSRVVGPALAGILIATVGMAACFLIDGISYVAVLAALVAMRPGELHPQARSTRERGHLVAGLKYAWRTDNLRRPLILMAVIFTVTFQWQVIVPLLAERAFGAGPREFGFLSAAAGIGSFAAAMIMANRNLRPRMRNLAILAVGMGLTMFVTAVTPSLGLAIISMIPVGFVAMAFIITGNTMLQVNSRPEARGRVMALYGMVFLGSTPIGAPLAGFLGEHLGPRVEYVIAGSAAVIAGAVVLWARQRRSAPDITEIDTAVGTAEVGAPA